MNVEINNDSSTCKTGGSKSGYDQYIFLSDYVQLAAASNKITIVTIEHSDIEN